MPKKVLSDFTFTFHFHALEKEMATHSKVLAWRIPGTGEPGGLLSLGSLRVGHDWSDLAVAASPSGHIFFLSSLFFHILTFFLIQVCCFSIAQACPTLCDPMDCSTPPLPGVCSNACPLSQWCYLTISSSVTLFSILLLPLFSKNFMLYATSPIFNKKSNFH